MISVDCKLNTWNFDRGKYKTERGKDLSSIKNLTNGILDRTVVKI